MRKIEVFGNLVNDPELKTDKNGKTFYSMRLANNEYNDDTYWFYCYLSREDLFRIVPHLKKGSSVFVRGDYKDSIYENTNTGKCTIDRRIYIDEITFLGLRSSTGTGSGTSTGTKSDTTANVVPTSTATPVSSNVNVVKTERQDTLVVDDLPF